MMGAFGDGEGRLVRYRDDGRERNERTRARFFQAIKDAEPERIKSLAKQYSKPELAKYISDMERHGCHQEAGLAREAMKSK